MDSLLRNVVVPVASEDDAESTARALAGHVRGGSDVLFVHVVEKAGGAPDKASVEQRELVAEAAFERATEILATEAETENGGSVNTRILYGTDVAAAIFDAAADVDATAIVFTPRDGSRWIQLLTGDVALDLITGTDRPVIVLPDTSDEQENE